MNNEFNQTSQEIKAKQYRNLFVLSSVVLVIVCFIYYWMGTTSNNQVKEKSLEKSFASPMAKVNTESFWMERAQNKLKEQEKETAKLKNEINQIKNNDNLKAIENDPRFMALQKQNQLLQDALKGKTNNETVALGNEQVFSTVPGGRTNIPERMSAGIDNDELNLKSTSHTPIKNPDTFVSAGTFAEAIMLGAADASAGVQSQANPSPMLFRIIAEGTLPNQKKSHLKGCVVTAAVVGDISSERGQIRLERLSCTFPNGEIVEQKVQGTIFGMDAKNGVRGTPVWREGALLGRAAAAGTLSGLGNAVSQSFTTTSVSPLGSTQSVNNGDIFKYGAATGVANGMEKLAEYNIKRAEQYHPVIQLTAGQPVDVVFLKGFYLDGRSHEDNKESSTTQLFPNVTETSTGLTLSENELQKIKKHEQNMGWINPNNGR